MVTSLDAAYETCARFARDHYENFPVASRLLPTAMRPHVAAVYAFARVADDFADEGERPVLERLALLDAWHARLHGNDASSTALPPETPHIFTALGSTIRSCGLTTAPFDDLLDAFRQDVTTTRYEAWDDVLDYCRRSANPVGRLVLAIGGYRGEPLERSSDALCTALQLANFWQDFDRDWRKGRLYLPLDECRRAGADTGDLDAGRMTTAWRQVLEQAAERTAALFEQGRHVCDAVSGRLRWELRLTWLGGRRILERLERRHYDVFGGRPALGAADVPALLWRAMAWRAQ
jgi:hydroxysqualene synthase